MTNPFGGSPKPRIQLSEVERLLEAGYTHLVLYPATNVWGAATSHAKAVDWAASMASCGAAWGNQYVIYLLADVARYRPAFLAGKK